MMSKIDEPRISISTISDKINVDDVIYSDSLDDDESFAESISDHKETNLKRSASYSILDINDILDPEDQEKKVKAFRQEAQKVSEEEQEEEEKNVKIAKKEIVRTVSQRSLSVPNIHFALPKNFYMRKNFMELIEATANLPEYANLPPLPPSSKIASSYNPRNSLASIMFTVKETKWYQDQDIKKLILLIVIIVLITFVIVIPILAIFT